MEKNEGTFKSDSGNLGRWTIHHEKCTTCCECIDACRKGLLYLYKEKNIILIKDEGTCTQCGDCASACAYGAIVLT